MEKMIQLVIKPFYRLKTKIMNSLHYGIASHPRLGYVLFWKRLLGQWSFYIKQKFGENFPTINDLHAMLQSNNYL